MLIGLSNSPWMFVIDRKNADRVLKYTWRLKKSRNGSYYIAASTTVNGKHTTIYLHRYLLNAPPGFDVHHKDENRLNNQEDNLELIESIEHRRYHIHKRATEKKGK